MAVVVLSEALQALQGAFRSTTGMHVQDSTETHTKTYGDTQTHTHPLVNIEKHARHRRGYRPSAVRRRGASSQKIRGTP